MARSQLPEKAEHPTGVRDVAPGTRVVDIPRVIGDWFDVFVGIGFGIVGIDLSLAMLEVARCGLAGCLDWFDTVVWDVRGRIFLWKSGRESCGCGVGDRPESAVYAVLQFRSSTAEP